MMHAMQTPLLLAYIWRLFLPVQDAPPSLPPPPQVEVREEGTGALTVSTGPTEIMGSLPRGATQVPFLTVDLSASCESDVEVQSIEITHRGLGRATDIESVYATENFRRVGRARRFDANAGKTRLVLPRFVIPRCTARRLVIRGDVSREADIAGEHAIVLSGPSDIASSAERVTLDATPDTVRVTTAPAAGGDITVNFLPLHSRLRYGTIATAARIQFSADNESDHVLRRILLTNEGTARNVDLQRLFLERSTGERVTRVAARMDGDRVALEFDPPFLLRRGTTVTLLLKGETFGSALRTVRFTLEEDGDLSATPTYRR